MTGYLKKSRTPREIIISRILPVLLLLLLSFLPSCIKKDININNLTVKDDSSLEHYKRVKDYWSDIVTLRGYFRITASINNKKGSIRALLAITLPESMRLELITPGGSTEAVMVVNKNNIHLYYPAEKVFFTGKAEHQNTKKILGIDLEPDEICYLVFGKGYDLSKKPDESTVDGNDLLIKYISTNGKFIILLTADIEKLIIKTAEVFNREDMSLFARTVYGDFTDTGIYSYPTRIKIDFPSENTTYEVKITNASHLLSPLPDKTFELVPGEVEKLYLLEQIKVDGTLLFGKN